MTEYTSTQLVKLVRNKYKSPPNSFERAVILEEVPNGTGGHQSRWIDVAVFETWPSKGLSRSAFEIKVSRSDFVNELRQPEKHQWCKECFHYFWFVAPKDVIKEEELPTNAGWMYPAGERLCVKRHAVRNDTPRLDDKLLAAFMRAAGKGIDKAIKTMTNDVLADSQEYKRARTYELAVERFLSSCNYRERHYGPLKEVEDIVKAIENVTTDDQLREDRERLKYRLEIFETEITSLLNTFLLIASKSLIARDEMGAHIWGADNTEYLTKHVKNHKKEIKELLLKLGELVQ
jgi:hypothetical protein